MKKLLPVALLGLVHIGVTQAQTPAFVEEGVVNAASFQPLLAPGVLAFIFGENLGGEEGCGSQALPLPTELCGTRVFVKGLMAPILFSRKDQVTVQIPVEVEPGSAELIVQVEGRQSEPVSIFLETHAPGLFASSDGTGTILHSDFTPVSTENPADPGEVVTAFAVGLGPTDPIVPTGEGSPVPPAITVTSPVVRVGCALPEVLASLLAPAMVGTYQVNLRLPEGLPGGNHGLTLEIGGQTSNEVVLPVSGPEDIPFICSAVSAASFSPDAPAAPGSILSLFAMNIGENANFSAFPATDFEGLSITFNGTPAPLFAVVPEAGQINVLAPTELPEMGQVEVRLITPAGVSSPFMLEMAAASPGIFSINDPTDPDKRFASALLANTAWLALPDSTSEALGLPTNCVEAGINPASFCGQPLRPGDALQLFVTGLGKATPGGDPTGDPLPTGSVAPVDGNPLYLTVQSPEITIGDVPAEVVFSGLAPGFAGLYQINAFVPETVPTGDEVPLKVSMPSGLSDTASIAIRP